VTGTYRHPAAWVLGLEGVALLRAHAGDDLGGEAFVAARLAEIRRILAAVDAGEPELVADEELGGIGVAEGYRE
jgi:hypothetical protein